GTQNHKSQITNHKLGVNFKFLVSNSKWHSLSEQFVFWQELEQGGFDLVHFPYFSHPVLYNKPFVVTIHDLTLLHHQTGKATTLNPLLYEAKKWGYQKVLHHAIYASQKIIVPLQSVKDDVLQTFPSLSSDKIVVTNEGVDKSFMAAESFEGLFPLLIDTTFFLYVGNCYPHKNVEFLIDAFAESKINSQLVCVTPDDLFTKRVKAYAYKKGVDKKIVFLHEVKDNLLKYLYQKTVALILPSRAEGFGLPVVEAAYCGTPLLLSDIPAFREVAPESAIFFSNANEKELIEKLQTFEIEKNPTQPSPNRGGQEGLDYFKKFSFEKMATQTLEIYKKLEVEKG
ncbi:MAG: glycosyltransferase family 1 protein, partial [Patescibacteria group bacterium]